MLRPRPPRRGLVARAALVERLGRSTESRVVLVVAGAGFGKTALLELWAAADDRPFAWLPLEDAHNDPSRLAADLVRTVGVTEPFGEGARELGTVVARRERPFV